MSHTWLFSTFGFFGTGSNTILMGLNIILMSFQMILNVGAYIHIIYHDELSY